MREFLAALSRGIARKNIPRSHSSLVENLKNLGALRQRGDLFLLDSSFIIGVLDISRDGTGYVGAFGHEGRDFIVRRKCLEGAMKGDIVLARRIHSRANRPQARIIKILEGHSLSVLAFTRQDSCGNVELIELKSGMPLPRVRASYKSLKVLPKETILRLNPRDGAVLEVLGVLSDPQVDEKISLALYHKEEAFPKACEEQARSFGECVDSSMYPARLDLRALPFCTIDPPDAKDHDDAIYFDERQSILYVAIADVSEYVTPHTPLDKAAKMRGFSIYFPHKSIPMLPRNLSENICSLKPHEDRLALVWKIRLHKRTAAPLHAELHEAIIASRQKLSYEEVDRFLGNSSGDTTIQKELQASILSLYERCKKLRKARLMKGYDFVSVEERLVLSEDLHLVRVISEHETPAHSLVEECMLLANIFSAKRLERGIFRVHEEPKPEKIETLFWDLRTLGLPVENKGSLHEMILDVQKEAQKRGIREEVDRLLIRSQAQARYSSQKLKHFGLGFAEYSHFTSPIRRYADLMLHRLLKAEMHCEHRTQQFYEESLAPLCDSLSVLERECARVEMDYKDRKYARAALLRLGEVINGVIVSEEIPLLARAQGDLQGARITLDRGFAGRMDQVKIRLTRVDLASAKIYGEIVGILQGKACISANLTQF